MGVAGGRGGCESLAGYMDSPPCPGPARTDVDARCENRYESLVAAGVCLPTPVVP